MGYWGEALLENDTAADVVDFWDTFIERGREHDAEFWTAECIYDFLRGSYFRRIRDYDLQDAERNAEILAIGALFLEHKLTIPPALKELLARSATAELRPVQLAEWGDPPVRRRVLERFRTAIGAKPIKTTAKHPVEREIAELAEWSKHYPRWIKSALIPRADDEWERLEPPFFRALWSFIGTGTDHSREALMNKSMMYRLMCLAFVTGWFTGMNEEETLGLIERAKRTKGDVSQAFMLRKRV
jgi:hypothetical protein